ncbi:MAG: hypothetical protein WC422_01840 [Candidatus Paceibacterota bacterium]|jgi:hypothetical protein
MKNIFDSVIEKIKSNLKLFLSVAGVIIILVVVIIYNSNFQKPTEVVKTEGVQETTDVKQNFLDSNFYSSILLSGQGNKNSGRYVTVLSDYSCG